MRTPQRVAVLGAGAWGTALAIHCVREGHEVTLWTRDPARAAALAATRENAQALPGVSLPQALLSTTDLGAALGRAQAVISAVPSAAASSVARLASGLLPAGAPWINAAKGLEPGTSRRLSELLHEVLPASTPIAVLSGPSFADEVAAGQPTAVVVAARELAVARLAQAFLSGPTLRVYASEDLVGVELCGALKNVVAIAAGLAAGTGLGSNPMAALVTRGLVEMGALAGALGASPVTIAGLAGLGDLVLTCTGRQSRNRRLGEAIARGATLQEALVAVAQTVEGVETTRLALALAAAHGVQLPITSAVARVLDGTLSATAAIEELMTRALRDETP